MKYFTGFNKVSYQINEKYLEMMDIFKRPNVELIKELKYIDSSTFVIEDGMSPDRASKMIYGDSNNFWIVLLHNNIIDFYKEWPTSYFYWKNQMMLVHTGDTFYSQYNLDLQKGDIVTKKLSTAKDDVYFDDKNYGVIVDTNKFLRSFDVSMIKGNINEGDEYFILRKDNFTFKRIEPFIEQEQVINEALIPHILSRKDLKQNSLSSFNVVDSLKMINKVVSPYSDTNLKNIVSNSMWDISEYPQTLLYKYINKININPFKIETFFEEKEKEWIFSKNIKVLSKFYKNQIEQEYYDNILRNQ